jgi:CRP/FNR family transcriptional regulator
MEPAEIIRKTDYFKSLSESNIELLVDICVPKSLSKKEILFLEGDKGHALYLCARGTIQLHKTSPDGQEIVIKVVKQSELFAEVILFEKVKYPVSAIALEETLVYLLPRAQFHCLLENEQFRNDFIAILMAKMRYLADQIQYLTVYDVEERLMRFLNQHYGEEKDIRITLSKKDVAAAIGTTPETLSRLILRLKEEGKMRWEGKRIQKKR